MEVITCCSSSSPIQKLISTDTSTTARRSANYKPSIYDFDFVQSLKSEYMGKTYEKQSKKLQEAVRHNYFNDEDMPKLARLELIDNVERLGMGYLFKNEIKRALDTINNKLNQVEEDLHAVSLHFRLLRQHAYKVSQDVFAHIMKDIEEMGNRKLNNINADDDMIKGILSLYEASYLAYEGETILDEAKIIATKYLNEIIKKAENNCLIISPQLVKQVKHSLELPLHWRMLRSEARWYIDNMSGVAKHEISSDLLELAKLDFNMVQAMYQDELKDLSRWWKGLGLDGSNHQFSFARDRLLESFIWGLAGAYEPQFHYCRRAVTKCTALLTVIDDIYDLYGTFDELKLFTDVVIRWDIDDEAVEQLPGYLKICFQAVYNTIKEITKDTLEETGWDIEYHIKKGWKDMCIAYLLEAKWYDNKYTPTLEEYLNNGWITGGPLLPISYYLFREQKMITKEGLKCLETYTDWLKWSAMIARLVNDLTTNTTELERGDVAKAIQCYMKESGVSEDAAREHIRHLTNEAWKKLNKDHRITDVVAGDDDDRSDDPLITQLIFKEVSVSYARLVECLYLYGDGHTVLDQHSMDRVSLLLVKPI